MQKIAKFTTAGSDPIPNARVWRKIDSSGWTRTETTLPLPRITKRTGSQTTCHIVIPADLIRARRVNILHDGASWIAIEPDDTGTYALCMSGRSRRIITIPARLKHLVPEGHTLIEVIPQDGLFLVSLGDLSPIA